MTVIEDILESDWFLSALSNVAIVSTICLFCTGFEICWRIKKRNSTDGISSAPFHMGFVSGTLWLQYGLFKGDMVVTKVNTVSSILYTLYVIYYWSKTAYPAKRTQNRLITAELVFLVSTLLYTHRPAAEVDKVLNLLGLLCVVTNVATVAAPLAALHEVMKARSTENLPLPLCVANLLVTMQWLLYGVIIDDIFLKIPNGIAVFISIAQLIPFMVYPRKRKGSGVWIQ